MSESFPIGTQYIHGGKHKQLHTVVDREDTYNSKGEFVRRRYVATHEFMGQTIKTHDVVATTIARGIINPITIKVTS